MTVHCINCRHFTMKPRKGPAAAHLTASDIAHARVGMGRCEKETLTLRWIAAGSEPDCDRHTPISEEQTAKRREWIGRNVK